MELLRVYSRQAATPSSLLEQLAAAEFPGERPVARAARRQRLLRFRMSAADLAQVAQDYRDGIGSTTLMKRYGLSKGSVLKILADHGVETRVQAGMDQAEVAQAVTRYVAGESLQSIGRSLGWDALTIRRAIAREGVAIRPRGRGPALEVLNEKISSERS